MPTENSTGALNSIGSTATDDALDLTSFLEDAHVARAIDQASRWAEKNYKHDRYDIQEALVLKLYAHIQSITKPRELGRWLHRVAKMYCLNKIRLQESINNASRQSSSHSSEPVTPEQAHRNKNALQRSRSAIRAHPAEIAEIVDRWVAGESEERIGNETGKSVRTIHRILRRYKTSVMEQIIHERDESSLEQSVARSRLSTDRILSAMEQMDPAELEALVPRAIALGATRRGPRLQPLESKLLARANEALPRDLKSRLSTLQKKRDTHALSKADAKELIELSDQVEQLHAERLEALADLARLRGNTLTELMDQLGIRFPANA